MATKLRRSPPQPWSPRRREQTLDEQIRRTVERDGYEAMVPAVMLVMVAVWEWVRWLRPASYPEAVTAIAAVAVGWAAFKVSRVRRTLERLQLGRDSEREVAGTLEVMRERGFRVFHDIQGPGFIVDHLLVGPQGLFVVEIKTRSKPRQGKAVVRHDGELLTIAGRPERDAVRQAAALARWIRDLVKDSSERNCFVRPVVLFPGWFVERITKNTSVWVLNPKMLAAFVEREPMRLGPEDVQAISLHLTRHVGPGAIEEI